MKSALYAVNQTTQSVAVDGAINPGSIIRRFGCNIGLGGNGVVIDGSGYYSINSSFTVLPTAVGTVTITAYKDDVAIPGATASETVPALATSVNLSIDALVRENCPCCDSTSNITFVVTGVPANITNSAIVIEKL